MIVTTIAIVVLKIAAIRLSVEASIEELSGEWYLQRYVSASSNNSSKLSCYKIKNEVVNETTLETAITYKLNDEPQSMQIYFVFGEVCEPNEQHQRILE